MITNQNLHRWCIPMPIPTISKRSRLLSWAFLFCLLIAPFSIRGQTACSVEAASASSGSAEAQTIQKVKLTAGAGEVARIIGILPVLEQLFGLPEAERGTGGRTMSFEALSLRQQITETVLTTSLEVDGVFAEIDSEIAQANEVRAYLESRRDRTVGINTIANIVTGGGVGVLGQLLQIKNNTLGNLVGAAAGGASSVLSTFALRQQRGGKSALGIAPNMLAKIFGRTPEFHSEYPQNVWLYLNNAPPTMTGPETRRQHLIKHWTELRRIDATDTEKGRRKVELLTSSISTQRALTIDQLSDRTAMLGDVRAQVALMKRDLSKLMLLLRSP